MSAVLETSRLSVHFGGVTAVKDIALRLQPGARHALIGPNGAGKTTLINLLAGMLRPHAGSIALRGRDITRLPPQRRVALGLARTFQINQLFAELTPLEAVGLAMSEHLGHGADWWRVAGSREAIDERIAEILERFHLADVMLERTSALAYGKQRLLEIALAIACSPRVLLLDEPAAGVPEDERHEILGAVAALPREVSVLFIEHDMDLVFSFAERISVMVGGALFAEGSPDEMARDPRVQAAYLGEEAEEA
jgi:branched-chain amino acid transport system ATP-binding protein